MTNKAWIIFTIICISLIGGLIYISNSNKVDVSSVDANKIQQPSKDNGKIGDHTYGNMKSKVILVEYGDFQCPGCGDSYPILKQVTAKYKNQLGFIFRNFPLPTLHPNALAAATTAEATNLQGKFWQMHDKLYENQNSWNQLKGENRTNYFVTLATSVGADGDKVLALLNGNSDNAARVGKKIDFDIALGKKQGVSGTPTLYLNGKEISKEYFKDGKLVPQNTSGAQPVWSNADALDTLVIKPALQANGMLTSK